MRVAKPKAIKPKVPLERDVQDEIVKVLGLVKGIKVYQTSIRKGAGRDGNRGGGQDKGIPDLLVSVDVADGVYIGLEVKRPGPIKWSSPEQAEGFHATRFFVVQGPRDALSALRSGLYNLDEGYFGGALHPLHEQLERLMAQLKPKAVA